MKLTARQALLLFVVLRDTLHTPPLFTVSPDMRMRLYTAILEQQDTTVIDLQAATEEPPCAEPP